MTTDTRTIDEIDLLDWRRVVFELYREIRAGDDPEAAWRAWRDEREHGLVLDFNFAYNPSCAYNPAWTCPLAPPGSRLDIAVAAGELMPA
jgi:hypothetical protein